MGNYALQLSEHEVERYRGMAQRAMADEAHLWERAGIRRGAAVADVGCGPGAVTRLLAETVGQDGRVWAVDADAQAVEHAATMAAHAGLAHVTTAVGDAAATGLAPRSLDAVMLRHVLAHNGGREQSIVDHLAALVRPGGCVYLLDVEASAARARPSDPDIGDLLERYHELHRRRGNDLSVGLRLGELLRGAGLDVVEFGGRYTILTPEPGMRGPAWAARDALLDAGLAEPADLQRWEAAFERADARSDRPTLFLPAFVGIGRAAGS